MVGSSCGRGGRRRRMRRHQPGGRAPGAATRRSVRRVPACGRSRSTPRSNASTARSSYAVTKTIAGGRANRPQHPGQLHAVQPGHPDVEEDRVDVAVAQHPQRLGRVAGGVQPGHPGVGPQQVGQLVQRRRLVVDGQHAQEPGASPHTVRGPARSRRRPARLGGTSAPACSPSCPRPAPVSTTRPNWSPKTERSRSSTLVSPTCWPGRRPAPSRGPRRRQSGPPDPCPRRRPRR